MKNEDKDSEITRLERENETLRHERDQLAALVTREPKSLVIDTLILNGSENPEDYREAMTQALRDMMRRQN